jgi:3-hydroxyisobutyrate dehydrogenase-like beta-hydroxyacid dehydrogenase
MSKLKVAVIGTGIMGTGVGLTLRAKGHDVTCWNRTKANAEELLRAGAVWKETPRAAAEGADFVVLLVWNEEALRAVTSGPDGLWATAKAGQVYVDMSTQLPATAVAEAREFEKRGAAFLDAPVHGTRGESRSGGLWIMVGGDRKVYDRALPLFQVIGATVHYMGPTGRGCAAKLCGNHFVSAILASMGEALALAEKAGVDGFELLKLWGESDFRSPIIDGAGHSMLRHQFDVSFHLRTMVKDTELVRNLSETLAVPVILSNVVHELNKVAQNRGYGEQNASAIYKVFQEMAGLPVKPRG